MTPPQVGGDGHADVANSPNVSSDLGRPFIDVMPPTPGTLRESFPPQVATLAPGGALTTQRALLFPIGLVVGDKVSSLRMISGGTAAGTPLNQLFGIYDLSGNRYLTTVDDTTTPWPGNTSKSLAVGGVNLTPGGPLVNPASSWIVPFTGYYLFACLVVATTVPNLQCTTMGGNAQAALGFGVSLATQTGLTALPNTLTLGAFGAGAQLPYCSVS